MRPRVALRPFQVPERKSAIVHIDLVSFGHDRKDPRYVYALTLVARWTRYMKMCPLLDTTTKAVVSAIEHNWIQYFGVMSILVSDQGPQFRGTEFQAFCERWSIKHNFSLAYSPSGNGCCEVLYRIVARLRAQPEPHNWVDALPKVILVMNTFVKQDIKMSAAIKAFNTNLRLPTQPKKALHM